MGNRILDLAHKELFNIIEWMFHLVDVDDPDTLSQAFEVLMDRLRSYFVVEENIAWALDFDFSQHKIAHKKLLDMYKRAEEELMAKYDKLPDMDAKKYISSLKNQLIIHINEEGAKLKQVLCSRPYDFKPNCMNAGNSL